MKQTARVGAGKKRVPDAIKLIKNTKPGAGGSNKSKPSWGGVAPKPPEGLSEAASGLWAQLCERLTAQGVIEDVDYCALQLLVQAYDDWVVADEALKESGGAFYESVTDKGALFIRAHPAFVQRSDAARRTHALLSEFGLTPASRSKVTAKNAQQEDPATQYFN